mmetsp:Transcript_37899/g.107086  ORF Transcript_37899/g.107086 Transcript_37899/m.107086 type:complete len:135 (-) Transcript_37899:65-469(-)
MSLLLSSSLRGPTFLHALPKGFLAAQCSVYTAPPVQHSPTLFTLPLLLPFFPSPSRLYSHSLLPITVPLPFLTFPFRSAFFPLSFPSSFPFTPPPPPPLTAQVAIVCAGTQMAWDCCILALWSSGEEQVWTLWR